MHLDIASATRVGVVACWARGKLPLFPALLLSCLQSVFFVNPEIGSIHCLSLSGGHAIPQSRSPNLGATIIAEVLERIVFRMARQKPLHGIHTAHLGQGRTGTSL
jgi:hypothetical protein